MLCERSMGMNQTGWRVVSPFFAAVCFSRFVRFSEIRRTSLQDKAMEAQREKLSLH